MIKQLFILGLLLGVAFSETYVFQGQGVVANSNVTQTETWQIGYGAQQIAEGDGLVGEILILAGVALIYIAFKKEKEAV